MDASTDQATCVITERMQSMEAKLRDATEVQERHAKEVIAIVDDIAIAAYQVQKWAHSLGSPMHKEKPFKPTLCVQLEDAWMLMHMSVPKLVTAGGQAASIMLALIRKAGDAAAEAKARQVGITKQDLQALSLQLDRAASRLGTLLGSWRPVNMQKVIVDMLEPHVRRRPALIIASFAAEKISG